MAGTVEGAKKAAQTKRDKYGSDFYARIGSEGGKARNESDNKYTPFKDKSFASRMAKKGAKKRWTQEKKD